MSPVKGYVEVTGGCFPATVGGVVGGGEESKGDDRDFMQIAVGDADGPVNDISFVRVACKFSFE